MIGRVVKSFQFRYPTVASYIFLERPLVQVPAQKLRTLLSGNTRIPQVVYQTWDTDQFGRAHAKGLEAFREKNPEFDFYRYTTNDMDDFMHSQYAGHDIRNIYINAKVPAMKADIWRYCMVYKMGGFYFDINKCINVPLAQLVSSDDVAIISFESNFLESVRPKNKAACLPMPLSTKARRLLEYADRPILNWGFGFEAGHPFLKRTIDNIVKHAGYFKGQHFSKVRDPVIELTGPHMLTRSIYEVLDECPDTLFTQLGIDFAGHGVPNMPGSWVRYATSASYVRTHGQSILE